MRIPWGHFSTSWHAKMSLTNQCRMFFVQMSTRPPSMHQILTQHGRCCMQNINSQPKAMLSSRITPFLLWNWSFSPYKTNFDFQLGSSTAERRKEQINLFRRDCSAFQGFRKCNLLIKENKSIPVLALNALSGIELDSAISINWIVQKQKDIQHHFSLKCSHWNRSHSKRNPKVSCFVLPYTPWIVQIPRENSYAL